MYLPIKPTFSCFIEVGDVCNCHKNNLSFVLWRRLTLYHETRICLNCVIRAAQFWETAFTVKFLRSCEGSGKRSHPLRLRGPRTETPATVTKGRGREAPHPQSCSRGRSRSWGIRWPLGSPCCWRRRRIVLGSCWSGARTCSLCRRRRRTPFLFSVSNVFSSQIFFAFQIEEKGLIF